MKAKAPPARPLLRSAYYIACIFLPALLRPFVPLEVLLPVLALGALVAGGVRPIRIRLDAWERERMSSPEARAMVMLLLTIVVAAGLLEYAALGLTDLGVLRRYEPMRTVALTGDHDWRLTHITADSAREPDPVLLWRPKPEAPYTRQRFKGPVVEVPKPKGVFRILCYGDSNTDGPDRGGWPRQLAVLLEDARSADGRRFEVLNAGVAGYSSHQGLLRYRSQVDTFEPDLIFVSFGWNDAVTSSRPADHEFVPPPAALAAVQRLLLAYRGYRVLLHYLTPRPGERESGPMTARVPILRYVENLAAFLDTSRARGARVVFLTRPHRSRVSTMEAQPLWYSRVPEYNRELRRFAATSGAEMIDVQGHFDSVEGSKLFVDGSHLGEEGYREMAAFVLKELVARGLLAP